MEQEKEAERKGERERAEVFRKNRKRKSMEKEERKKGI